MDQDCHDCHTGVQEDQAAQAVGSKKVTAAGSEDRLFVF